MVKEFREFISKWLLQCNISEEINIHFKIILPLFDTVNSCYEYRDLLSYGRNDANFRDLNEILNSKLFCPFMIFSPYKKMGRHLFAPTWYCAPTRKWVGIYLPLHDIVPLTFFGGPFCAPARGVYGR